MYDLFRTLNINGRAIVRVSQAVAKNMIDAGIKGSIVNISSTISTVSRRHRVGKHWFIWLYLHVCIINFENYPIVLFAQTH